MDGGMPKSRALDDLLSNDMQAAELYSVLPEDMQTMVRQNAARYRNVRDMERCVYDYLNGEGEE